MNVSNKPQEYVVVVQLLSHVQLFATSWTAACQASLSFTISQSLLKLMSIESMMPSNNDYEMETPEKQSMAINTSRYISLLI